MGEDLVWKLIICGGVIALYAAAYALLFYNVIVFMIGQQRYKAKSKLLSIFYFNSFLLLTF